MRRYLLDTGPAQEFIHKREPVYSRANELLADGNKLGVGMPVVGELFAGVEYSATREKNYSILMRRLQKDSDFAAIPGLTIEDWS